MSDVRHLVSGPGGEPLATLVSSSAIPPAGPVPVGPGGCYVLSRFAYAHVEDGDFVVESPLTDARLLVHDWRVPAMLHRLRRPCRLPELAAGIPSLTVELARSVIDPLLVAGLASDLDAPRGDDVGGSPALELWEFHDLLFHGRTRGSRHGRPVGGTWRFLGRIDPPPAVVTGAPEALSLALHRPELDRLQQEDPPLARVQEARRSVREYGAEPISEAQLGEFLYRVGRVADFMPITVPTSAGPVRLDLVARPYPAAGSLYELELYCAVHACRGVARGLYRYEPGGHQLQRLSPSPSDLDSLLEAAGRGAGLEPGGLQVLIVVAGRLPRLAWKYQSIAYSLMLKDVGVLYATMYLAATAMGLAPCALGYGDSDVFARAAGTDYYAETSVGEFLLGSAPAAGP